MATPTEHYLAITALGVSQPMLVDKFSQAIVSCNCNILNTRMTAIGSEFAILALISGNWSGIAKLETAIPSIEKELGITTNIRRTTLKNNPQKSMIYVVHVVTIDRPTILNKIANFFYGQNINIEDINSHTYKTHRGTRMVAMTINVTITVNIHIPSLREKFMSYCDELNIDAGMEPLRD